MTSPPSRRIGLIGGMSWESSALYYRRLNHAMQARCGEHANARSVLVTLSFAELVAAARADRWDAAEALVAEAGRACVAAGAELVALTAVTAHRMADALAAAVPVPVLHVADAVGAAVRARGWPVFGLLGTATTMETPMLRDRIADVAAARVVTPPPLARAALNELILTDLTAGRLGPAQRAVVDAQGVALLAAGATGIVLGCTELPLLYDPVAPPFPALDAVQVHVDALVAAALA